MHDVTCAQGPRYDLPCYIMEMFHYHKKFSWSYKLNLSSKLMEQVQPLSFKVNEYWSFFCPYWILFYLIEYVLFCCKINGLLSFLFLVVKQMSYFLLLASVSSLFLVVVFIPCFSLLWSKEQRGLCVGVLTGRPQILFTF